MRGNRIPNATYLGNHLWSLFNPPLISTRGLFEKARKFEQLFFCEENIVVRHGGSWMIGILTLNVSFHCGVIQWVNFRIRLTGKKFFINTSFAMISHVVKELVLSVHEANPMLSSIHVFLCHYNWVNAVIHKYKTLICQMSPIDSSIYEADSTSFVRHYNRHRRYPWLGAFGKNTIMFHPVAPPVTKVAGNESALFRLTRKSFEQR